MLLKATGTHSVLYDSMCFSLAERCWWNHAGWLRTAKRSSRSRKMHQGNVRLFLVSYVSAIFCNSAILH